jgi:photosystem II stability/assembly factor-like uncharacterized protein
VALVWTPLGPRPTTGGQVEGLVGKEVVGAIKAVVAHPTNPGIVYVGAVNGGVWRTRNGRNARPTWEQLTDAQRSQSIGALDFDPTDSTYGTLVAGTGRFSSLNRVGGALIGLLRTTDGGAAWTTLDNGGQFRAFHICDVAPRGQTIVIAANNAGIFRTTDAGGSWTQVSGAAGTGLPAGISFALTGDPTRPDRLFAHIGTAGIFRTSNTGGTWTKVSNAAIDALLNQAVNVKISVGANNNVYVAIADSGGLTGLFRSGNSGGTWAALDRPSTIEANEVRFGLHPGRQASTHLSLAADRVKHRVVYIGGDRQPAFNEPMLPVQWPNSVGARDYSGRIFRVDAARPRGSQASHLTHSNTASHTAPHADSRDMAVDAQGDLIEGDDGGVYRRSKPLTNTADWASMNGDLQTTELHSAAWDANSRIVIGGAQDTGTPQQRARAGSRWPSVSTGDGGVVVVDDTSAQGRSVRYSSYFNLGYFRREVYDAAGILQSWTYVPLNVLGHGAVVDPQFNTPLELNQVAAARLIIGATNGVYESDDQGDTITAIGPGIQVNSDVSAPIAYGAQGNADVLYVGSGRQVFVRTAAHPAPLAESAAYPGTGPVVGIAIPPAEPQTAFAIDAGKVFRTTDAGGIWKDVTSNLLALGGVVLRSVAYCEDLNGGSVVVGTNVGVFAAAGPGFNNWSRLGSGLPTVPVLRLRYGSASRVLLAATLGRGAWTLDIA